MKTLGDSLKIDSMMIDSLKGSMKIDSMKGSKVSTDSKNSLMDSLMMLNDSLKDSLMMLNDSLKDSLKDSLMIDSLRFVSFPLDSPFHSSSLLPASRNRNSQAC